MNITNDSPLINTDTKQAQGSRTESQSNVSVMPIRRSFHIWRLGFLLFTMLLTGFAVQAGTPPPGFRAFKSHPAAAHQLESIAAAIAVCVAITAFQRYRSHVTMRPIFIVALPVALFAMNVAVLMLPIHNGVHRWVYLGRWGFEPAALTELFLPLSLVWITNNNQLSRSVKTFCICLLAGIIGVQLIEHDLSTLIISYCCAAVSGPLLRSRESIIGMVTGLIVVAIVAFTLNPAASRRLHDFIGPKSSQIPVQIDLAKRAIRSGGAWGQQSLGHTVGYAQIPVAASDFAFAQMVYLFGAIPGILFLLCFWLLLDEMLCMPTCATEIRNESMVCTMYILANGALNLLSNVSMIPTGGVPCPFLSRGGTAIVTASVAVVLPVILILRPKRDTAPPEQDGGHVGLCLRTTSVCVILCIIYGLIRISLSGMG